MEIISFLFSLFSLHPEIDELSDKVFIKKELRNELTEIYTRCPVFSDEERFIDNFIVTLDDYSDTFNYYTFTADEYRVLYQDLGEIIKSLNEFKKAVMGGNDCFYKNFIIKYVDLTVPHIQNIRAELNNEFKHKNIGNSITSNPREQGCVIM